MKTELIERFEETTGLTFDPLGPDPIECDFCADLLQFVPDHDCYGMRAVERECQYGGHGMMDE